MKTALLSTLAGFAISLEAAAQEKAHSEPLPALRIEPGIATVPANHLKFYLYCPEPMARGDIFRHIRLVTIDEEGTEIDEVVEPFREIELWDESATRLTLWFHPGRQKPGVNLNVEMGPILEEGKRYRLEISEEWRTETGRKLARPGRHEFRAGPEDKELPDRTLWFLHHPPAQSYHGAGHPNLDPNSLVLATGESLDPVSAAKSVSVRRNANPFSVIVEAGFQGPPSVSAKPEHLHLVITPLDEENGNLPAAWPPGKYEIVITPTLEDLAGNSLLRPFNRDLARDPDQEVRPEPVILPFMIPDPAPNRPK